MGDAGKAPTGVLLVGSIPLKTPEEVFTTIPSTVGKGKLHSLPDGEPGERDTYIWWQRERFPAECRRFNPVCAGSPLPENHPGFTKDSIPPTGYGDAAVESWKKFEQMQKEGKLPEDLRFQVSLPMPQDCIQFYCRDELQDQLGPMYEQRMKESVQQIIDTVPAEKLAIQWDIAVLPTAMEYEKGRAGRLPAELFQIPFKPLKQGFIDRLVPFCNMVPAGASLGLHICYGDFEHTHHIQPEDMGVLVDIANSAVKDIGRPVQWIHVPVPKDRDDAAYFAPLKDLNIGDSKLYLGLVHVNDEEGTRRRIAQAQKVVQDFGVATECGLGRYTVDEMRNLMQISDAVTA